MQWLRSEADDDVAGAVVGGFGDEAIDEGFSVAGDELNAGGEALLGVTVGVEGGGDGVGMAAERGLFFELEAGGHATEAVHLVAHFGGGDGGGAAEGLVDGGEVVGEGGEFGVKSVAGGGDFVFAGDGHGTGGEAEG